MNEVMGGRDALSGHSSYNTVVFVPKLPRYILVLHSLWEIGIVFVTQNTAEDEVETEMDTELLRGLGQIAGIGGVALGVFLLLFRDVIQKKIFSKMGPTHSYRLMRQILYLVWSIAVLGIIVWAVLQFAGKNTQQSSGNMSPNISNVEGDSNVEIKNN